MSLRKRIKTFVAHDPETGSSVFVNPSDPLPDWLNEDDLNPGLFAGEDYVDEEDVDLESMTVRELIALANRKGVELTATKKSDIIEAIRSLDDPDADLD